MKITFNTKKMLDVASALIKIVPAKTVLPILDNFIISADEKGVSVLASGGDTSIRTLIPAGDECKVEAAGKTAVPARILNDILKESEDENLTFETKDSNGAVISWEGGKSCVPTFDPADFPEVSFEVEGGNEFSMPADFLLSSINATSYAMADDQIRPILCGIHIETDKDKVTVVATDSHRLVWVENSGLQSENKSELTIPRKEVSIVKMLAEKAENCRIQTDAKTLVLSFDENTVLALRFVVGKFPGWRSVVPKETVMSVTTNRKYFISVLKRIGVCSSVNNHIKMEIVPSLTDALVEVSAQNVGFAIQAKERTTMSCSGNTEEKLEIGFKGDFLIDVLNGFNSEEVTLCFIDKRKPVIVKPVGEEENIENQAIIMPILVSD